MLPTGSVRNRAANKPVASILNKETIKNKNITKIVKIQI